MTTRRLPLSPARSLLAIVLLLAPLAACGEEGGIDRTDARAVAAGLVAALAHADFDVMERLMSPQCYEAFQQDLTQFQVNLAQPETPAGRFVHRIGRERLGEAWPAAVSEARAGSFRAAWRLFVRLQPIPDPPDIRDARNVVGDPDRISLLYRRAGNRLQQIDLRRGAGGLWVVERVAP